MTHPLSKPPRVMELFDAAVNADIFNCRRDRDERIGFHVDDAVRKLPYGKVLCTVRLSDIIETNDVELDTDIIGARERLFGNYEPGRYAWYLDIIETFSEPIPAKGNRMLWNWKG